MLQTMQGSNKRQETIELIRNYMAASESLCGWRAERDGPAGPENGILRAYSDGLSGGIYERLETSY
jgi:hypothetical protein